MLPVIKWPGVIILTAVLVAAATAALMGSSLIKTYAMNQASAAIGRRITVKDMTIVGLSLTPRIRLEGVRLENAAWSGKPYMLAISRLAFGFDLLKLLKGRTVISDLEIKQPRLDLAISPQGRPNWAFLTAQSSTGSTGSTGRPSIPVVHHWHIDKGRVIYRDSRSNIMRKTTIASAQGLIEGPRRHVSVHGNGRLAGKPWRLAADLNALWDTVGRRPPDDIHAQIAVGHTRVQLDGSVAQPLKSNEFALDFTLRGSDPAELTQLAPLALPHLPPYRIQGRLKRNGNAWSIEHLVSNVGVSDIAGNLALKTGGERPRLRANLASDKLDFVQIFGPGEPSRSGPVVSDTPIDVSPLRMWDAQIRFQASRIYLPGPTFDNVSTTLSLKREHLTFKPLKFDYLGGTFDSHIEVAANARPVQTSLKVQLQQLSLNEILANFSVADQATGIISGQIDLDGRGRSPADMLASADGSLSLVMGKGRLDALLIEAAGLDVFESLALMRNQGPDSTVTPCTMAGPWCRGDSEQDEQNKKRKPQKPDSVRIRCLIADFKVRDGLMTAQTLMVDTPDTKIVGRGTIDLGPESVDLTLLPRAKDFSLFAGQAPLHVKGSFRNLGVNVSKERVLTSLLSPIELGTETNANCRKLRRALRQH